MERYKPQATVSDFLERRLHAIKLAANLMAKELASSPRDSIILSRSAAESIFYTIDTFIEDAENALNTTGRGKSGGAYREVDRTRDEGVSYVKPTRPLREVKPLK